VHRLDAARLFRLALEHAAPGARLHATAEEGVTLCAIAQAISAGLGVPVRSLAKDEARTHFDWLAGFVAMDNPTSSALTRNSLGLCPQEPELLTDMRDSGYFS
jgi:nucleoside-diphosphate-sugar epimerase